MVVLPGPPPVCGMACRRCAQDSNLLAILALLADELVGNQNLVYAFEAMVSLLVLRILGDLQGLRPTGKGVSLLPGLWSGTMQAGDGLVGGMA